MFKNVSKFVCVASACVVMVAAATAQRLSIVQGSGSASAINETQFAGSGELRIGWNRVNETSLTTIESLVPGPNGSLVGTSTHTLDCGVLGSIVTSDHVKLIPINSSGLYRLYIDAEIVGGTRTFTGATGRLIFTGTANLATGQVNWRVLGLLFRC